MVTFCFRGGVSVLESFDGFVYAPEYELEAFNAFSNRCVNVLEKLTVTL